MYKEFAAALGTLNIKISSIPSSSREKLIGALSRSPKALIISIPLFLSLYRHWCHENKSLIISDTLSSSSRNGEILNTNQSDQSSLKNSKLMKKIRGVLSPLMQEVRACIGLGTVTINILNSSLKICGIILPPIDLNALWSDIQSSVRNMNDNIQIGSRNVDVLLLTTSIEELFKYFNYTENVPLSGKYRYQQSVDTASSSGSGSGSGSIIGSIQRDIPAPLLRKAVTHQLSSILLTDGYYDSITNRSTVDQLKLSLQTSESRRIQLEKEKKPLRYQNTLMHNENILGLCDEGTTVSNTHKRVVSYLQGMSPRDLKYFTHLLSSNPTNNLTLPFTSMSTNLLDYTTLFDSLSKCGLHLRMSEREDLWAVALSGCCHQSTKGRYGSKNATLEDFFHWAGVPYILEVNDTVNETANKNKNNNKNNNTANNMNNTGNNAIYSSLGDQFNISVSPDNNNMQIQDLRELKRELNVINKPVVFDCWQEQDSIMPSSHTPPKSILSPLLSPSATTSTSLPLNDVTTTTRQINVDVTTTHTRQTNNDDREPESVSVSELDVIDDYRTYRVPEGTYRVPEGHLVYSEDARTKNEYRASTDRENWNGTFGIIAGENVQRADVQQPSSSRRHCIPASRPSSAFSISSLLEGDVSTSGTGVTTTQQLGRRKVCVSTGSRVGGDSVSSLFGLNSYVHPYVHTALSTGEETKPININTHSSDSFLSVPVPTEIQNQIQNQFSNLKDKREGKTFEEIKPNLIKELQKQRIFLALLFRQLVGVQFNEKKEKLVKCIDFSEALLKVPIFLKTTPEAAWLLTCEIKNESENIMESSNFKNTVAYSDVINYLEKNRYIYDKK